MSYPMYTHSTNNSENHGADTWVAFNLLTFESDTTMVVVRNGSQQKCTVLCVLVAVAVAASLAGSAAASAHMDRVEVSVDVTNIVNLAESAHATPTGHRFHCRCK